MKSYFEAHSRIKFLYWHDKWENSNKKQLAQNEIERKLFQAVSITT